MSKKSKDVTWEFLNSLLNSPSPITLRNANVNNSELDMFVEQTIKNYKKIINKTTEDDLALYLPETFINMLSGVTFFNQYLLQVNMFLERLSSQENKDQDYNKKLLEVIFAHTGKFRGFEKFNNDIAFLSTNLLNALTNSEGLDVKKIRRLKEISIIFIIIEEFFRNHQAHGQTLSLIDFFRGFNIGIFPVYIFSEKYIENFSLFSDLEYKFYFSCPREEFERFRNTIYKKINEIKIYEIENNCVILDKKVRNKLLNIMGMSKEVIDPEGKWTQASSPIIGSVRIENKEHCLINSDIMRSYFKYYSLVFNNDTKASNIKLIKEALVLHQLDVEEKGWIYSKKISIHPEELCKYFEEFTIILKSLLID